MDFVQLLLQQNIIMFIYLVIGYLLFKTKLVTSQGSSEIARLLLYLVMPMAILNSYITEFSKERAVELIISFLAAVVTLFISIIVTRFFFKKEEIIERFGVSFSNAGFIGIPLVQMTLGNEAVFYVSSFVALLNILQWTYGVYLLSNDKSCISLKRLSKNPIIISFLIGLLLFFLPISIPKIIVSPVNALAAMNGPLAMIVLGTYLAQGSIKSIVTEKLAYKAALIRLVIIPIITIFTLYFIPEKYETLKFAVLIAASAPIGSNVAIFAQQYNQDYTVAVREVCLSTILCIITMPLIIGIAGYIY